MGTLSLTNRRLNFLVSPLLYKSIVICNLDSCKALLRTLHEKDHIGLLCTSLALLDDGGELPQVENNKQRFSYSFSGQEALHMVRGLEEAREFAKWTMQLFGYQGKYSTVKHLPFPICADKSSSFAMINAPDAYLGTEPPLHHGIASGILWKLGFGHGWCVPLFDFPSVFCFEYRFETCNVFQILHYLPNLPEQLEKLEISRDVDDEWVGATMESDTPYLQEGYEKVLHGNEVPTFRFQPMIQFD